MKIGSNTTCIYKGRIVSPLRGNSLNSPVPLLIVLVSEIFPTEKTIIKSCEGNGNWDSAALCEDKKDSHAKYFTAPCLDSSACGLQTGVSAFQEYKQDMFIAICNMC